MRVMYFSTFVSSESGASHALRQTARRVTESGICPLIVIPDSLDSRKMFPTSEFNAIYVRLERPRRTRSIRTNLKYFASQPRTLAELRKIIRKHAIDVVHCNEILDFVGGVAAKLSGVPCVYHVRHDGIPNPFRKLLTIALDRTADAIIVPSRSTVAWLQASTSRLAERINLIRDYAFDIDEYQKPVSGASVRCELGIGSDEILVLLVSKLITPKGHLCFIRAAQEVGEASKHIKFAIVGGPVPGHSDEAAAIKALGSEIAPSLMFLGPRHDLAKVYAASDIVVHCPIYPDPYPTVVLLAMLAGKPIIGTRIGGLAEQLEEGELGILVPPDDSRKLAAAILELGANPDQCKALGSAGKAKMTLEVSQQAQGRIVTQLYDKVLHGQQASHAKAY